MKKYISKIMEDEHKRIEDSLIHFEKLTKSNPKEARRFFRIVAWNLEKHVFIEEKVIFGVYSLWYGEEDDIIEILKKHKEILFLVRKIETTVLLNQSSDISDLKNTFNEHFELEREVLYPRLEEVLDVKQRELFLDRAQEIIIG